MKKIFLIIIFLFNLNLFAQQLSGEVIVKVDNQKVEPKEEYIFNVDEPLKFEAEGLKPNSVIKLKIIKAGITFAKEEYKVESNGKVFEVLETPETKVGFSIEVSFETHTGKKEHFKFKLHFK